MPIQSLNPATGEVLRAFPPLTAIDLDAKIAACANAFLEHRETTLEDRAMRMRKLAALLEQERGDLASLITQEMGKTIGASEAEIDKCVACCRFYAAHAGRFLAREPIATEAASSFVQYEPMGPLLAIMPWNFPFWQVFRFAVPNLMAANVLLLKHAPSVPMCALRIEGLLRQAGFPRGALTALLIETDAVEGLLNDERVMGVTVTGSERAGRAVAAQAGWLLKKSVLELGGSDPFIVMPTADLEAAVAAGVKARMLCNGQSCIAAKRFIVHQAIYPEFERQFVEAVNALKVGDPVKRDSDVGPLFSARGLELLEKQVDEAVASGARILTGGTRMVGKGFYFEPTVLTGPPRQASVYREEIFGPVAVLFSCRDVEDAIAIANDTPFGLGASVWTREPGEQERFIRGITAGMVFLNSIVASDPRLPFGGVKRSGYGRELGGMGIREFVNAKTVSIA